MQVEHHDEILGIFCKQSVVRTLRTIELDEVFGCFVC